MDKPKERPDSISPPPLYAIWAAGTPDGPFAGRSGFLSEEGTRLFFWDKGKADCKVHDLENLCLNGSPGVEFQCVAYPGRFDTASGIALEELKPVLLQPRFTRYTIQNRIYGNTGGGCMVATLETYLPELDKTIWVNCNLEGADLTSADHVWNEDHSESWERYDDVALVYIDFAGENPQTFPTLAPLIQEAVTYFLQEEMRRKPAPISFPAKWLPGDFREADHEILAQAQKDNADILILPDGTLQRCDGPEPAMQDQTGRGYPHLH